MAFVKNFSQDEDDKLKTSQGEAQGAPLQGGGSSVAGGTTGQPDYTKSNFVSGKSLIKKNQNAAMPRDLAAPVQQQWGQVRDQSAQNRDAFTAGIDREAGSFRTSDTDFNRAVVQGDTTWQDNLAKRLLGAPRFKDKEYQGVQAPNVNDVNAFNSSAGIQSAFEKKAQKQGQYGYTQGQGALDSTLFARSDIGRQTRQDLGKQFQVTGDGILRDSELAGQAKTDALGRVKGYQNALSAKLNTHQRALSDQANKATERMNNASGDETRARMEALQPQVDQHVKQVIAQKYGNEPQWVQDELAKEMKQTFFPQSYVKLGKASGPQFDAQGASQWNNIMNILGKGNKVSVGKGRAADEINTDFAGNVVGNLMPGVQQRYQEKLAAEKAAAEAQEAALAASVANGANSVDNPAIMPDLAYDPRQIVTDPAETLKDVGNKLNPGNWR